MLKMFKSDSQIISNCHVVQVITHRNHRSEHLNPGSPPLHKTLNTKET